MDNLAPSAANQPPHDKEKGKVGMAILLWLLGVPGSIVLLYLIFAH